MKDRAKGKWFDGFKFAESMYQEKSRADAEHTLEHYVDEARCFHDYNEFDRGMEDYMKLYDQRHGRLPSDRSF